MEEMDNRKPCYTRYAEASGALNDSCCNSSNAEAGVLMVYHQVTARPFPKEVRTMEGGNTTFPFLYPTRSECPLTYPAATHWKKWMDKKN
ncbi:hypothetical protein AVEN_6652-1 [Araneus ventricosus]|uniref:Uncharacterized protein n=1 Tax=Araneus ventricosus TaxID=182803 RepID=A0A4Y2H4A2_ARAVE|nr:hypothetical protein AVEN_6652-1 [Araneus ventricosus]